MFWCWRPLTAILGFKASGGSPNAPSDNTFEKASFSVAPLPGKRAQVDLSGREVGAALKALATPMLGHTLVEVVGAAVVDRRTDLSVGLLRRISHDLPGGTTVIGPLSGTGTNPANPG